MRSMLLCTAGVLTLGSFASSAVGQEVIQEQANPRGSDAAAVVAPNPQTAAAPVAPAMPADPAYHGGPYVGALTAPPAEVMNKQYPVCTRRDQDNCQNPGEGGAPGRSRALHYWPGRSASEMRERFGG